MKLSDVSSYLYFTSLYQLLNNLYLVKIIVNKQLIFNGCGLPSIIIEDLKVIIQILSQYNRHCMVRILNGGSDVLPLGKQAR
jgi:hypothetical protein